MWQISPATREPGNKSHIISGWNHFIWLFFRNQSLCSYDMFNLERGILENYINMCIQHSLNEKGMNEPEKGFGFVYLKLIWMEL